MASAKYQGVILAAGHGSRMGPFGDAVPKPIAPICNKPLLVYQLEYMRSIGIEDVIVVIGHLGERISHVLGDGSDLGLRLHYVEQKQRLGLAHAVGQLDAHIDRPFLLMLGDIFFDVNDLGAMAAAFEEGDTAAVLAVKDEPDPEAIRRNFAVLLRDDGTVRRVIEKPLRVPNSLKGCGIYLFDQRVFEAVRRTPRTAMRDEYELTDSIQILIDYGYPVRTAGVVDWDVNVTFIEDLITCCVHQLGKSGLSQLVGDGASLSEGTTLIDTVVGERARIEHPIRLERCVVLPDVTYSGTEDLFDSVITQDAILRSEKTT